MEVEAIHREWADYDYFVGAQLGQACSELIIFRQTEALLSSVQFTPMPVGFCNSITDLVEWNFIIGGAVLSKVSREIQHKHGGK